MCSIQRWTFLLFWFMYGEGQLGMTEIEIRGGKARILRFPCKLKFCAKPGYIQYADRISVCLPNRAVVRVEGNAERGLDAVVS